MSIGDPNKKVRLGIIYAFVLLAHSDIMPFFFNILQSKMFNVSFNEYTTAVNAIHFIQDDDQSTHTE